MTPGVVTLCGNAKGAYLMESNNYDRERAICAMPEIGTIWNAYSILFTVSVYTLFGGTMNQYTMARSL
jgi:hypothetical protein